jgi:holliday junction DNA helicase RuvA
VIARIAGRVGAVGLDSAVVDVGGVGLAVQCTPATLARLRVGEPVELATSLVVREDALTLYGFADAGERATFELLQSVGGVGPRLALAVLAVLTPDAVRAAIATDDPAALTRVPGIGKKGAQRIVLELRDKVGSLPEPPGQPGVPASGGVRPWTDQVRAALVGLGYSAREADDAIGAVTPELDGTTTTTPDVAAALRLALSTLTRA